MGCYKIFKIASGREIEMRRDILIGSVAFFTGVASGFLINKQLLKKEVVEHTEKPTSGVKTDEAEKAWADFINSSKLEPNKYEKAKIDYGLISRSKPPCPSPKNENIEDEVDFPDPIEDVKTGPYMITPDDFSDNFLNHDKITISYYVSDGVLCDEGEVVIDDPIMAIGQEAIDELKAKNGAGCSTIWVRNDKFGIDYEVVSLTGVGYSGYVMGGY